jgi:hypothetical protein
LSDGTAYLTQRSLSRLCGIANSTFSELTTEWNAGRRESKLARWLVEQRFSRNSLYTKTNIPGVAGNVVYAYQEDICNLILEYYAFEVSRAEALTNYRLLGRAGFRLFVYGSVGYDPKNLVPEPWREFHDRMAIHILPSGYFSVFRESADFIILGIQNGLTIDHRTVPDISIGRMWATYWRDNGLEEKFGAAKKSKHNYPDYFPQAASNPQDMNVYPVAALGEFRTWLLREWIPKRFPGYLASKVKAGILAASTAELLLTAAEPLALPESGGKTDG